MREHGNLIFCGVGGQGILLASSVTCLALIEAGFDLKKSEVHGMAQRGGSVVAHLRYGSQVASPLIEAGTADVVVGFEEMEAARYLPLMHKGTTVVVNLQRLPPPVVATGRMAYPQEPRAALEAAGLSVVTVDGAGIATRVGEPRAANMAVVGALSHYLPVEQEVFEAVLRRRLPRKIEENLAAFRLGRERAAAHPA